MAVDAAPRDEREAGRVRLGVDETPPSFRRARDPRAATMASRRDLLEEVSRASARVGAHIASDATGLELVALVVVCGVCVVLQALMARRGAVKHGAGDHVAFQRLRRRYNAVYALGTFGDWIQGAYLYALYREHGFEMADIGYIFVLGYFASATLGTYVASLGDEHGHRKLVMLYGVSYGIACVAMRWSNLAVLLVSRVLSGVAYSLLFSSFESWAITEADRVRVDRRYLVQLFSAATFFNAVSAVAAGIAGNAVVIAPPGRPYARASQLTSPSSHPLIICTSPSEWYGFVSSLQNPRPYPSRVHVYGRSRPVPLWHESISAVRRTPSGRVRTKIRPISSSVIWPATLKSLGRIVSFIPSSSYPCGSGCCAPWPLNAKNRTSPGSTSWVNQRIPFKMFARVGSPLGPRAPSSHSAWTQLRSHPYFRVRSSNTFRTSLWHPRSSALVPR